MGYNSKYSGEEVEILLDKVSNTQGDLANKEYVNNAIADAIIEVLNTEV